MKVLVTNDDGIEAAGLAALVESIGAIRNSDGSDAHEIWVVAPESERSGVSHAMTLRKPSRVKKVGERRFTCSGTPADCVILAGLGIMDGLPDLVISGINRGANLGTDIIYSGTCGAARQAALVGIPAIAFSCVAPGDPFDYRATAAFAARNLAGLLELWKPETFVNVNAPSGPDTGRPGRWAVPGRNRYIDKLRCFDAPDGFKYCFLAEGRHEREHDRLSDHHAVAEGYVSVSLISLHPVAAHDGALNGSTLFA